MSKIVGRLKLCLAALLFCAVMPTIVLAEAIKEREAKQAQGAGTQKPYQIKGLSHFACAEVATDKNTGSISHEIKLAPNKIERCEFVQVGSRLHECKKYRFSDPTINESGIVSIDTDDGALQFWLDQHARVITSEESKIAEGGDKGTLTFYWPDKNKNYLCVAMR